MNDSPYWYQELKKPSWAPAENVFGTVWSILYPIIFFVNIWVIVMVTQDKIGIRTALPFWLNILFNISYTPIQFGLKNNVLAAVDIVLVLGTIIWSIVAIWPHNKWLAIAYVPYLIWVGIATALQISIAILNR